MAAFKAHCTFGFWKYKLLFANDTPNGGEKDSMGQFGRITSLADFPKDTVVLGYIKEAMRLNDEGIKLPPKPKAAKPAPGKLA
jgi:hypothetical protein